MKLNLSHAEATALILSALGITRIMEVVIGDSNEKPATQPAFWATLEGLDRTALNEILSNIDQAGNIFNKIACIKALRGLGGYGLKEAKDAIEHWQAFLSVAIRLNRWPSVNYRPAPAAGFASVPYFD